MFSGSGMRVVYGFEHISTAAGIFERASAAGGFVAMFTNLQNPHYHPHSYCCETKSDEGILNNQICSHSSSICHYNKERNRLVISI